MGFKRKANYQWKTRSFDGFIAQVETGLSVDNETHNLLVMTMEFIGCFSCVSNVCGLYDGEFYDEKDINYCNGSINDHSDNIYTIGISEVERVLQIGNLLGRIVVRWYNGKKLVIISLG